MSAFYFSKTFSVVHNIAYIFLFGKWHSYAVLKDGIFLPTLYIEI